MSGQVVKFLGYYRNTSEESKALAIKKTTDKTLKRSRLFREYQNASYIGRSYNVQSIIAPLLRYSIQGWSGPRKTLKQKLIKKAQSDLDKYDGREQIRKNKLSWECHTRRYKLS